MRKAITPVISIIILLLITVALAGTAWTFIVSSYSAQTAKVLSIIDSTCSNKVAKMTFINSGSADINITTQLAQTEPYVPDANTRLLYHFDEGSGSAVADSSKNNNNGTLTNMDPATDWVTGAFGTALDFDDTDDHIAGPDDPSLDITGQITLEAWVYPRLPHITSYPNVVTKGPNNDRYLLRLDVNNKAYGIFWNAVTSVSIVSTGKLTQGWHHVAVTYDSATGNMEMFIDGRLNATKTSANGWGNAGGTPLTVSKPGSPVNAIIDEVRVSSTIRDFTSAQTQGWNYACPPSGNTVACGDLIVEKTSGSGSFLPGFTKSTVSSGQAFTFKDSGCVGSCNYQVITPSGAFQAGAVCG